MIEVVLKHLFYSHKNPDKIRHQDMIGLRLNYILSQKNSSLSFFVFKINSDKISFEKLNSEGSLKLLLLLAVKSYHALIFVDLYLVMVE